MFSAQRPWSIPRVLLAASSVLTAGSVHGIGNTSHINGACFGITASNSQTHETPTIRVYTSQHDRESVSLRRIFSKTISLKKAHDTSTTDDAKASRRWFAKRALIMLIHSN